MSNLNSIQQKIANSCVWIKREQVYIYIITSIALFFHFYKMFYTRRNFHQKILEYIFFLLLSIFCNKLFKLTNRNNYCICSRKQILIKSKWIIQIQYPAMILKLYIIINTQLINKKDHFLLSVQVSRIDRRNISTYTLREKSVPKWDVQVIAIQVDWQILKGISKMLARAISVRISYKMCHFPNIAMTNLNVSLMLDKIFLRVRLDLHPPITTIVVLIGSILVFPIIYTISWQYIIDFGLGKMT